MSQIRVKSLGSGSTKKYCTQENKSAWIFGEKANSIYRIYSPQDIREMEDLNRSKYAQHQEPDYHNRTERGAYYIRSELLHEEESNKDYQYNGNDRNIMADQP